MTIQSRPPTEEYRDNFDRIFRPPGEGQKLPAPSPQDIADEIVGAYDQGDK